MNKRINVADLLRWIPWTVACVAFLLGFIAVRPIHVHAQEERTRKAGEYDSTDPFGRMEDCVVTGTVRGSQIELHADFRHHFTRVRRGTEVIDSFGSGGTDREDDAQRAVYYTWYERRGSGAPSVVAEGYGLDSYSVKDSGLHLDSVFFCKATVSHHLATDYVRDIYQVLFHRDARQEMGGEGLFDKISRLSAVETSDAWGDPYRRTNRGTEEFLQSLRQSSGNDAVLLPHRVDYNMMMLHAFATSEYLRSPVGIRELGWASGQNASGYTYAMYDDVDYNYLMPTLAHEEGGHLTRTQGARQISNPYYHRTTPDTNWNSGAYLHTPASFLTSCYKLYLGRRDGDITPSDLSSWLSVYQRDNAGDAFCYYLQMYRQDTVYLQIPIGAMSAADGISRSEEAVRHMRETYGLRPVRRADYTGWLQEYGENHVISNEITLYTCKVTMDAGIHSVLVNGTTVCGSGSVAALSGQTVSLRSPSAEAGFAFLSYTSELSGIGSTQADYSFSMPSRQVSIRVNSRKLTHKVRLTGGNFIRSVSGDGDYLPGTMVTITAQAENDSSLWDYGYVSWSGGLSAKQSSWENTFRYTFPMPDRDLYLTADAIRRDVGTPQVTLTVSPVEWTNGSVTVTATASDAGGREGAGLAAAPFRWRRGGVWGDWTGSARIEVTQNQTIGCSVRDRASEQARNLYGISAADNVSPVSEVIVRNIDRTRPVLYGAEELVSAILAERGSYEDAYIDRDLGRKVFMVSAEDDLSGIRSISIHVTNYDNGKTADYTLTEGQIGNGRVPTGREVRTASLPADITEDLPVFLGHFALEVRASDMAGNEAVLFLDSVEFYLRAELARLLGDSADGAVGDPYAEEETQLFKRGESGKLTVIAAGYADRIVLEFAPELETQEPYSGEIIIDEPEAVHREAIEFMVPLETPEGAYRILIHSYRRDETGQEHLLKTIGKTLEVRGSVLDELRSILR